LERLFANFGKLVSFKDANYYGTLIVLQCLTNLPLFV